MFENLTTKKQAEAEVVRLESIAKNLEKNTKDSQIQIDRTLAEVVRLEGVAKDLEESNKQAQVDFEKSIEAQSVLLKKAEEDTEVAKGVLTELKSKITIAQEEKTDAEKIQNNLKEEIDAIQEVIRGKHGVLEYIDADIKSRKKQFENDKVTASKEMQLIKDCVVEKREELTTTENNMALIVAKFQREKVLLQSDIETRVVNIKAGEIASKKALNAAQLAEARQAVAEKATVLAEDNLIKFDILTDKAKEDFETATSELATLEVEVKALTIERLNSKAFMDALNNKESNLKRKYEEVGLEYKQ